MASSHNSAFCPYCKRLVNTSNAIDFQGIEYNDTPIRYCSSCANMFFDTRRGEPAIDYYNSPPPSPKNAGWGWVYMFFFGVPGVYCLINQVWIPGALLCALALIIVIVKVKRKVDTSTDKRRTELSTGVGLTTDVAFSLKRMRNPEYVKILMDLGVEIPEWFTRQLGRG